MKIQGLKEQEFQMAPPEPTRSAMVVQNTAEMAADTGPISEKKLDRETVVQLVESVEKILQSMGKELNFRVDEDSQKIQVEVIDPKNHRVIKKIPADEILALASSMEKMVGVFLNKIS